MARIQQYKEDYPLVQEAPDGGLTPQMIIKTLWELTNGDATVSYTHLMSAKEGLCKAIECLKSVLVYEPRTGMFWA